MIREWFETAAAHTVRFVARWVWRFLPSILWLTVALVLLSNLGHGVLPTLLLVALLALAVASFIWSPLHGWRPFVADWRRLQRVRANRRARVAGYRHAVAMGVVKAYDEKTEAYAMKSPAKRLPPARLVESPDTVSLFVEQIAPFTDDDLVKRAHAYAPVLSCPAEYARIERLAGGRIVRFVWPRTAPVDKLAQSIDFPVSDLARVDADAPLVIGRADAGGDFRLPVFGRQTLLVGASGAGKGSVIWSVLLALAPAIRQGTVRVWGIDLKGGVEFTAGAGLFHRIAYTYDEARDMLGELRGTLDARLAYMREHGSRKHVASEDAPYELLLIDEAASLTYLAPDTKTKSAVDADLRRILSTARAAGIAVFAALQDPRKEALTARDLFTQMVGLRLRSRDDAQLALGGSAYEAGAHCELIPQAQPGTGYAIDAESGEVVRFRAFWCSDAVIQGYAARYGVEKATAPEGDEVQA